MSPICQNFVQNAWKKELCSNCFKSKTEHVTIKINKQTDETRRSIESIIKKNKTKPKHTVSFTNDLTEVIGFGGEDWSESEEDFIDNFDDIRTEQVEDSSSDEEDKQLKRITKSNTDFNTTSLLEKPEIKKTYVELQLGKPLLDSEGKKQTLKVSVTPFGHENVKIIKTTPEKHVLKNKEVETVAKSKTAENIEGKEKSLLDEISETLENGKNPIQIVPRKKIQKEITLKISKPECDKENVIQECNNNEIKKSQDITEDLRNSSDKRINLQRTPVIKKDQEKPVIYQSALSKIELLNNRNNQKSSKNTITLENKLAMNVAVLKIDKESNENTADLKLSNEHKTEKETKSTTENKEIIDLPEIPCNIHFNLTMFPDNKLNCKKEVESKLNLPIKIEEATQITSNYSNIIPSQTREQPDGRADPDDNNEPPALPLTPPPSIDARSSFLHGPVIPEKPKVPLKPTAIFIKRTSNLQNHDVDNLHKPKVLSTFCVEPKVPENITPVKLTKQNSDSSDIAKLNKRKAPQPPASEEITFSKNYDSMEAHEMKGNEKLERASSCNPIMSDVISNSESQISLNNFPEPAPRKSLSMSIDSLANCEDKKKDKSKGRFSLKKLLRMGSNKDLPKTFNDSIKNEEVDGLPSPKPRLVIVHPSELNGSKVEVVAKSQDKVDFEQEFKNTSITQNKDDIYSHRTLTKPPPPPRNTNSSLRTSDDLKNSKPVFPHPPKSAEILNKQKQLSTLNKNNRKVDTVYANIGEVRSALCPNKPQRTASMREREAQQLKQKIDYESIDVSKNASENVYDYINGRSSSPEYDSSPEKIIPTTKNIHIQNGLTIKSESSIDVSGDYFKYQNIPRSISLTYCGSETESEIYSPYSFYGSESEINDDEQDWIVSSGRTHKLRSRKGRSIVHKNLEDNYGAVVVANHEALAQVLENIQHGIPIQPALRGLKSSPNLRWTDFTMISTGPSTVIGSRTFQQAMWGSCCVTLVISSETVLTSTLSFGTYNLVPITEFTDLLPAKYLPNNNVNEENHLQAYVAVLPWMQIHTIQSIGDVLQTKINKEDSLKDGIFIMLQVVNALKMLQSQGIEELPMSLNTFVLCKEMEKESFYKVYVLQGFGDDITRNKELGSLCAIALKTLTYLLPNMKITSLIESLLNNERAVSLTQVKSVLEFSLWGPTDVSLGGAIKERELALQRWLDLQRATVLHGLVCAKVHLTVYEECHLMFLVRSTSKMVCDASILIESNNIKNLITNGSK